MVKVLGSLLTVVTILTVTLVYAPALAELSNYNPQGLKATTLEEVLVLPDEEIDLATAILILSKEWDASFDIKESLEEINRMALEVRVLINAEDDPERVVSLVNHYLFERKSYACADYSSRSGLAVVERKALPQVIKNKKGDCVGLSILYLVLTERLELPFYGVVVPRHFFVRYDNGEKKINIETTREGKEWDDREYEKQYGYPTYRKYDFYLRNLSKKEVIGVFLSNLGAAYINRAMYDRAFTHLKTAIEINTNDGEAQHSLGIVYDYRGMYDEAIIQYKKAIEINSSYDKAYYNLGIAYAHREMYDEAIIQYKKAIEINSKLAEAYYNLGIVYAHKGMYDEAIVEYKKAIEINPNDDSAHCNLGTVYIYKTMYDEAIVEFITAMEMNPDSPEAYTNLGVIYSRKGMHDDAITVHNKAIEINPDFAEAHLNLGATYYRKREYSLAIQHYDRAIELGSSVDPELLEFLEPYRED